MTAASGRCLCGAVSFTAEAVKTRHYACHCGMCLRWSGGPLFDAPAQGVRFKGKEDLATYQSSDWAERGFCARCGSNLFYRLKQTDQYMMCVGSFDDPTPFKLVGEFFIDRKPPGYDFAGDLNQLTEAEVFAKFAPPEEEKT